MAPEVNGIDRFQVSFLSNSVKSFFSPDVYANGKIENISKDTRYTRPWPGGSVVRLSFSYAKVEGSIPGQGTYENQLYVLISGAAIRCFSLLPPSL